MKTYEMLRIQNDEKGGEPGYELVTITEYDDGHTVIEFIEGTTSPARKRAEGIYEYPDGSFDAFIDLPDMDPDILREMRDDVPCRRPATA